MNGSSPILSLPDEMLMLIIEISIFSTSSIWSCERVTPTIASSICQRLRKVALATPNIWTDISIHKTNHLHRARLYLNRSKTIPLDITISILPGEITFLESILHELIVHIDRWRTFRLTVAHRRHLDTIFSLLGQPSAPLLELFELDGAPCGVYEDGDDYGDYCGSCSIIHPIGRDCYLAPGPSSEARTIFADGTPSLKTVCLRGDQTVHIAPFDTVQTLHLYFSGGIFTSQSMFSACLGKSLTRLFLQGFLSREESLDPLSAITLPTLTSLYMICHHQGDFALLNHLEAPSLQRLLLADATGSSLVEISLSSECQFPNLQLLIIDPMDELYDDDNSLPWVHLSECFPSVEHLAYLGDSDFESVTSGLLEMLAAQSIPSGVVQLWPRLHTLTLKELAEDQLEYLLKLSSSRLDLGLPLHRFFIENRCLSRLRSQENILGSILKTSEVCSFHIHPELNSAPPFFYELPDLAW